MLAILSEVIAFVALLVICPFVLVTIYHLIVDEDDPKKLELECELHEQEWNEFCSKL